MKKRLIVIALMVLVLGLIGLAGAISEQSAPGISEAEAAGPRACPKVIQFDFQSERYPGTPVTWQVNKKRMACETNSAKPVVDGKRLCKCRTKKMKTAKMSYPHADKMEQQDKFYDSCASYNDKAVKGKVTVRTRKGKRLPNFKATTAKPTSKIMVNDSAKTEEAQPTCPAIVENVYLIEK